MNNCYYRILVVNHVIVTTHTHSSHSPALTTHSPLSGINNCPLTNNIDVSNVVYNDICKDLISSHFQTSK